MAGDPPGISDGWQSKDFEWARLQTLATQITPNLQDGRARNFLVLPYEVPNFHDGEVLVRAKVLDRHSALEEPIAWSSGSSDRALLRMRLPDWELHKLMRTN